MRLDFPSKAQGTWGQGDPAPRHPRGPLRSPLKLVATDEAAKPRGGDVPLRPASSACRDTRPCHLQPVGDSGARLEGRRGNRAAVRRRRHGAGPASVSLPLRPGPTEGVCRPVPNAASFENVSLSCWPDVRPVGGLGTRGERKDTALSAARTEQPSRPSRRRISRSSPSPLWGKAQRPPPWPSAESRPHGAPGTAGSAFPLTGLNPGTRRREARQQKHPPRELDRGSGDAISPNTGISGDQALDGRRTLEPGTRTAAAAKTPRGCPAARFPSPGRSGLFAGRSERVEPQRPRRCRPPSPAEGNPRSGSQPAARVGTALRAKPSAIPAVCPHAASGSPGGRDQTARTRQLR